MLFHSVHISVRFDRQLTFRFFGIFNRGYTDLYLKKLSKIVSLSLSVLQKLLSVFRKLPSYFYQFRTKFPASTLLFQIFHFLGTPILQTEHDSVSGRSTALLEAVNDAADCIYTKRQKFVLRTLVSSRGHSRKFDLTTLFGITLGLTFAASCTTILIYWGLLVI
jgi:hypothetical protein